MNWNPNTATPDCDWCGDCDWCDNLPCCGVEDCGQIRCDTCDERMACVGPEPRACGTACVDCPCDCATCFQVREELRAELVRQIEKEGA